MRPTWACWANTMRSPLCAVHPPFSLPVCCALGLFSVAGCCRAVNHLFLPLWTVPLHFSLLGSLPSRAPRRDVVMGTKGMRFPSPSSNHEEMTHTCDIFRYLNGPSAQVGRRGRRQKSLSTLTLRGSLVPLSRQTVVSGGVELWSCPCACLYDQRALRVFIWSGTKGMHLLRSHGLWEPRYPDVHSQMCALCK